MLEPVGGKQQFWHMGEDFKCPTQEYPYIFTSKNSAKALEEYKHAMNQTTNLASTDSSTSISTSIDTTISTGISTSNTPVVTSTEKQKHHKHHKSDSDSFTRKHYAAFTGLFLLMMIVLIIGVCRRQEVRVLVHGAGRRHVNGFTNPQYLDENDDVEIWNRSNVKSGFTINNDLPKTHGTRITFE